MARDERIRKYLDAANTLGQVNRGRAEEIVRELANAGDIRRKHMQQWVDTLVDQSQRNGEEFLKVIRREVSAQLNKIDTKSLDRAANQVSEALRRSAEAGQRATRDVQERASKTVKRAQTAAGRGTSPRGTASKKTAARKTASKRAPAKKAASKKAPAKKSTAKKGPAKKTAAKKKTTAKKRTPAKKTTAKKGTAAKKASR